MRKGLAMILVAVLLLTGCAPAVQEETAPAEESTVPETAPAAEGTGPAAPTDYVTEEQMALADPWAGSDESALAAVMKKAARGEAVTIAVIGGSITQGTVSTGSRDPEVAGRLTYGEIFRNWWETAFPETEVNFVNAGIGATDSYLGVHRVQEDVLAHGPDLVLVEFSVNDGSSPFYKTSYDNLLRTLLLSKEAPAVMLLFLSQTNGTSAQDIHSLVGFNYKLPMVSGKNVFDSMMDAGTYSAGDLSGDTVHPSALGHRVLGEVLWKYLNSVYEAMDSYGDPAPFQTAAVTKEKYTANPTVLDSKDITPGSLGTFTEKQVFAQFPNGWVTEAGEGELTFTLSFRNLGVLYYCQTDGNGGQFEVLIDGEPAAVLNADFSGGWGNYAQAAECWSGKEAQMHTVVIRKCADSTGEAFAVLGLLVS